MERNMCLLHSSCETGLMTVTGFIAGVFAGELHVDLPLALETVVVFTTILVIPLSTADARLVCTIRIFRQLKSVLPAGEQRRMTGQALVCFILLGL